MKLTRLMTMNLGRISTMRLDIRTAMLPFMFIFNHEILLWGIDSWALGILIFVMTTIGAFAFASATQGYFADRNRWYDSPLLLGVSALMFRPDYFARWVNLENYHLIYVAGLALWAIIYLLQKMRKKVAGAPFSQTRRRL